MVGVCGIYFHIGVFSPFAASEGIVLIGVDNAVKPWCGGTFLYFYIPFQRVNHVDFGDHVITKLAGAKGYPFALSLFGVNTCGSRFHLIGVVAHRNSTLYLCTDIANK